jgi:hypothetical protein
MKNLLLSALAAATLATGSNSYALLASDNGGNYGAGWTNGANGGSGFLAWSINVTPGTGFAGNFIGNPASAGIAGMSATSFGLFANPTNSGASVSVDRSFASAMSVGDTFSFQWGVNFDSDGGDKGFNLYTGGTGGTQLLNVNQAGFPGNITFEGTNTAIAYGTNPMVWSFTLSAPTSLLVTSTGRDGSPSTIFSTNITVSAAPDAFRFYASGMNSGDQRQPYFNSLSVVPEPSTYALLALSGLGWAGFVARRRAKR